MDDQSRIADERHEFVDHAREAWLVLEDISGVAMNARRIFGHVAFGIDQRMKNFAGCALADNLDRADFQDAMSLGRIEAGRFRIEHDLTHDDLGFERVQRQPA